MLQQADQDGIDRVKIIGAKNLRDFEKRAADRLISQGGSKSDFDMEYDPATGTFK